MAANDIHPAGGYRCGICGQKFHHPSLIYCCDYGHFFCQKCYKQEYYTGKDPVCPHHCCKASIYRMDKYIATTRGSVTKKRGKKMFPEPDSIVRESVNEATSKRSFHSYLRGDTCSTHSLSHLSRKPVNCPYPGCEKTIAITAVDGHFKYEHKFVACISTCFDTRNGLEFNPHDVKYNEKLCIVLINIVDEEDQNGVERSIHEMGSAKPVMLVMATRVPFYQLNEYDEAEEDEDEDEEEEILEEFQEYNCHAVDKILLWVASNVPTKCKYTIAVSTPCKAIRLKYFGTISQINDNCVKLCEDGRGLILNQPHAIGMTNNGKKPLSMDIVLHREDSTPEVEQ
ncbi:hypothetical protein ILUMI_24753 [Ignelater luminosus]|uniref:DUF4729 domain-containing protein n=1 Tax=Ignelater luminosus TaxID=2038154 RepID=A0A8K0G0K8_IGNLU|nr:hypothetical protein ILUMI_24753 [Ignelater luminosus]